MNNIKKQIEKAIETNLPSEVGKVLKKRLDQADNDAERVLTLTTTLENAEKEINELSSKISKYAGIESKLNKLETLGVEIEKKLTGQKIFEAELKANAAEARANEIAGFVGMVFKSPIFRRTILENTTMTSYYSSTECKNIDVPQKNTCENIEKD